MPRVLSPLRSLGVRNEVDLVPLACEDAVITFKNKLQIAISTMREISSCENCYVYSPYLLFVTLDVFLVQSLQRKRN